MSTEGIVDDQSGSQDTRKILALETNTVETADTEEWMTMNQSLSGRKKIGKNSAALKGQMPPVTTSPSRYHVLSADLEEGEVEETRADSSDDEDSVDSESALEKKKQMEKAKTGKNKKSQKNGPIATNGTKRIKTEVPRTNKPIMPPHGGTNMMMSIFAWNTRGFNEMRKHTALRSWVQIANPSFGCLTETRVQEGNSESILHSAIPNWNFLTNYDHHRLGKIWICWADNVTVTPLHKSAQSITVWVTSDTGEQFLCSCVYASNFATERQSLWSELNTISTRFASSGAPWIVMGDFNETLASSEHSLGTFSTTHQRGMVAFQSLVTTCDLTDLASIGPTFTWTNNQSSNPIAKKLDRVLVNANWLASFPEAYANFEPSGVSDHTRCWIHLDTPPPGNKRPFKFFNFLVDHPDFKDIVATVWESTEVLFHSTSALYRFNRKLKLL
ncbi:Uncharacterized protein Rs2_21693 [Raphanus sativus]|nr:Uncharacterized protein Rs2_21693 [Raphanus sativus]